ncbi:putative polyketide synthetase mbtD [Mycobacterium sp. MAC_080597_8934]|nr:putative polyketide synthetase mbtD [Mycobacterium sp. MAC_080597_8934]
MMPTHGLPDGRIPVLLSSHDPELIRRDAAAILEYLDRIGESTEATGAVAATLLRLRRVRRHRALLRAADRAELAAGLAAIARGEEHALITRSARTTPPRIAFVFPGRAINGRRWAPTPTGGCRPTARRPIGARRRSSPPGSLPRSRIW